MNTCNDCRQLTSGHCPKHPMDFNVSKKQVKECTCGILAHHAPWCPSKPQDSTKENKPSEEKECREHLTCMKQNYNDPYLHSKPNSTAIEDWEVIEKFRKEFTRTNVHPRFSEIFYWIPEKIEDPKDIEAFITNSLNQQRIEVFKACGCSKCRSWLTFEELKNELPISNEGEKLG